MSRAAEPRTIICPHTVASTSSYGSSSMPRHALPYCATPRPAGPGHASPGRTLIFAEEGQSRGHARAPALPGWARHRRDLVQPVVPLADVGRGLRHFRLPGHQPGLRHAGGRRRAHRQRRTRSGFGSSSTSSRTTARISIRGFGPRFLLGRVRKRDRFWFRPGRGPSGDLPPNDWQSIFGTGRPGRGFPPPGPPPVSGTCTCSRPSSRISTGRTRRSAPSSRTCSGSGSIAARTASGSTPRR